MPERPRASSFGGARPARAPKPTEAPQEPEPEISAPVPPSAVADREAPAAEPSPFLDALVELLARRGLEVPEGLEDAPPAAYAGQGAGTVAMMARLPDKDLVERAGKVAGWQARQNARAHQMWESSPLIGELRRRGLPEPERPPRPAGVAFSLKRPLAEWSDDELQDAAIEWARLGQ